MRLPFSIQERNSLLDELLRSRKQTTPQPRKVVSDEAEHLRLCMLEDKIKEVLAIIKALNDSVSTL